MTDYVDPLIGSGGHGHVFVGVSTPFGAVKLGPENIYKGWDWCSGYNYGDSILIGFAHLHLSGTGIGDLADILIMPYTGPVRLDKGTEQNHHAGYSSIYSHKDEKVTTGYYSIKLEDGINVELTATERVGYHKYHFHSGKNAHIIIDLKEGINDKSTDTQIEQTDEYTLKGYRFSSGWAKEQQAFFAIRFSQPIQKLELYDNDKLLEGKSAKGLAIKGLISFEKTPGTVQFKVGISPVSADNALANIEAEIPNWDFAKIVKETEEKWNKELSKVIVTTKSLTDKRVFYTALFHSMMHPSLFDDHNGDYQGADNKIYKKSTFTNYTVFSLWDTYRAAHPLYTLLNPDRVDDFVIYTMLSIYDKQGFLPIWHLNGYETGTMVGISSLQVIAEAYLKGFRGFDAERAYNAIKTTAMSDTRGLNYVRDFKPIPSDARVGSPVARAMEYAISDGSIALMAKAMGKTDDYNYFEKRAENYKLYYDPEKGFFRGKMTDGSWNPNFDPIKSTRPWSSDWAEGNSWQYLWLVPQDVKGLISLLGGENSFISKLDTFFSLKPDTSGQALADLTGLIGQYAHGNEPSHHVAYMYNWAGQPWKTQERVHQIVNTMYLNKPDGLCGNDDCGQMSAWYIFSSLGFYPVCHGSGQYAIGSPSVKQSIMQLGGGKKLTIIANNLSEKNIYIRSVTLNGKPLNKSIFKHSDIANGGELIFDIGNRPNKKWAANSNESY